MPAPIPPLVTTSCAGIQTTIRAGRGPLRTLPVAGHRERLAEKSAINQRGSNRDSLCYPNYACFNEDPRPEFTGYRWAQDLWAAVGVPFELSTGFIFGRLRLELSFAQRMNGIDFTFRRPQRVAARDRRRRRGRPGCLRASSPGSLGADPLRTFRSLGHRHAQVTDAGLATASSGLDRDLSTCGMKPCRRNHRASVKRSRAEQDPRSA